MQDLHLRNRKRSSTFLLSLILCIMALFHNCLCLLQVQVQRPRQWVLWGGAGEVALRLPAPYSGGRLPEMSPFLPGPTLGQGHRGVRQRVPEWVSASWPAVTHTWKPKHSCQRQGWALPSGNIKSAGDGSWNFDRCQIQKLLHDWGDAPLVIKKKISLWVKFLLCWTVIFMNNNHLRINTLYNLYTYYIYIHFKLVLKEEHLNMQSSDPFLGLWGLEVNYNTLKDQTTSSVAHKQSGFNYCCSRLQADGVLYRIVYSTHQWSVLMDQNTAHESDAKCGIIISYINLVLELSQKNFMMTQPSIWRYIFRSRVKIEKVTTVLYQCCKIVL